MSLARFQFLNSSETLQICRHFEEVYGDWKASIACSVETGEVFSQALPFRKESEDDANHIGQIYQGPVLLICDALCYSTTDMFVAAFEDNNIGAILGTSGNTGAGGANMWKFGDMKQALKLGDLPGQVSVTAAVLRATRSGVNAGAALEDLGVQIDKRYFLTENDVLFRNRELIAKASDMLDEMQPSRTSISASLRADGENAIVCVRQHNLDRVDVYFGSRPIESKDLLGRPELELRLKMPPDRVRVLGFRDEKCGRVV